jgi:hypothetical protein
LRRANGFEAEISLQETEEILVEGRLFGAISTGHCNNVFINAHNTR